MGKWLMGIKEGTCWDEHWVLFAGDESLDFTPEIMVTNLDINVYE